MGREDMDDAQYADESYETDPEGGAARIAMRLPATPSEVMREALARSVAENHARDENRAQRRIVDTIAMMGALSEKLIAELRREKFHDVSSNSIAMKDQ